MRFSQPLVVLAATAAVSAQGDNSCEAGYIVEQCLSTEQLKIGNCQPADYDCLCAAYQAVATCYNNCPNDPRGSSARQQVTVFCSNASIHGSRAQAARTSSASTAASAASAASTSATSASASSSSASEAEATGSSASGSSASTVSASASAPTKTGAAEPLSAGTNGALMAIAGLLAVIA